MFQRTTEETRWRRKTARARAQGLLVQIHPRLSVEPPFVLPERAVILGRSEDCDLAIDDGVVSRHHARVEPHEGGFLLTDLNSTNGTLCNGQVVMGKRNELDPGPHRRRACALKAAGLITLILAGVFWRVTTTVLGARAAIMVLGASASLLIRGVQPASSATDIVARKSFVQRLGAAAVLFVSWVAGRYVRRDNRRYLAFGSLVDEAFLTNSKRRWPTG